MAAARITGMKLALTYLHSSADGRQVPFQGRRTDVKLNYDIFRRLPGDGLIWIEAVEDLELARLRMFSLMESHPSEYFVYDHTCGKTIFASSPKAA